MLEHLVEYDSAEGRWEEAIEEAQRRLALDNLNETAYRNLMFLFTRSGKRNAALHQYKTCCRLLREELGQDPDEQTASLAERIRLRKIAPISISTVIESQSKLITNDLQEGYYYTKISPPSVRSRRVDRSRLFIL